MVNAQNLNEPLVQAAILTAASGFFCVYFVPRARFAGGTAIVMSVMILIVWKATNGFDLNQKRPTSDGNVPTVNSKSFFEARATELTLPNFLWVK